MARAPTCTLTPAILRYCKGVASHSAVNIDVNEMHLYAFLQLHRVQSCRHGRGTRRLEGMSSPTVRKLPI